MEFAPSREKRSSGTSPPSCAIVFVIPVCALQLSTRSPESSMRSNHDNTKADCCTNCPVIRAARGDVYVELYINEPKEINRVALFRHCTRVLKTFPWLTNSRSHPGPHVICRATLTLPSST